MSGPRARIAVFLSGHGFGHAVRTASVLEALSLRASIALDVVTSAPTTLWPEPLRAITTSWCTEACDAGIAQRGDSEIDVARTIEAIEAWHAQRDSRYERLAASIGRDTDLVLADVPPLPLRAAADRAIPGVAIANFSWDWIYSCMGLEDAAASAAAAYRETSLLIECIPAAPMPSFTRRQTIGTIGRDASGRRATTRARLRIPTGVQAVLLALRPVSLDTVVLPPPASGRLYLAPTSLAERGRADAVGAPEGCEFLDLLAASDVVVSKPGYGVIGDCMATRRPLLWAPRLGFPEDRVLEPWLDHQSWARSVPWSELRSGQWGQRLDAIEPPPVAAAEIESARERAVDLLLELLS